MNELIAFEKHKILRWAPLELKNACLRASSKLAEREVTAVFSNMGMIKLPREYEELIERFGVYTSTPRTEVCVCSFKDILYFGFTSRYDSTNIQKNFYKILKDLGAEATKLDSDLTIGDGLILVDDHRHDICTARRTTLREARSHARTSNDSSQDHKQDIMRVDILGIIDKYIFGNHSIADIHRYGEHDDTIDGLDTEVPPHDKARYDEQDEVDDKDKGTHCDLWEEVVEQD